MKRRILKEKRKTFYPMIGRGWVEGLVGTQSSTYYTFYTFVKRLVFHVHVTTLTFLLKRLLLKTTGDGRDLPRHQTVPVPLHVDHPPATPDHLSISSTHRTGNDPSPDGPVPLQSLGRSLGGQYTVVEPCSVTTGPPGDLSLGSSGAFHFVQEQDRWSRVLL